MTLKDLSLEDPRVGLDPAHKVGRPRFPVGWNVVDYQAATVDQIFGPICAWLNGKLHVYGGENAPGNYVFVSSDGAQSWEQKVGDWYPRRGGAGGAAYGRLWIAGGVIPPSPQDDTWWATDPQTWRETDEDAGWGPRQGHAIAAFGGKLYLAAGVQGTAMTGDVWSLESDFQWRPAAAAAVTQRMNAAMGSVAGQLLIMGGQGQDGPLGDYAISPDGRDWTPHGAPWPARSNFAAVTVGDVMFMLGGLGPCDMWRTRDGLAWTEVDQQPPWPMLHDFGLAAVDDYFVVIGGMVGPDPAVNDKTWAFRPPGWLRIGEDRGSIAGVQAVTGRTADGLIVVIGQGFSGQWFLTSRDGLNWSQPSTDLPRRRQVAMAFDGQFLWVSGGINASGQIVNEVYKTADGLHWTPQPTPGWVPRKLHGMVFFHGRLWLFGGQTDRTTFADVWSCDPSDGVWRPEPEAQGAPDSSLFATAVFDDKIWILGGAGGFLAPTPETWSTPDGLNWTRHVPQWSGRWNPRAHVVGDTLYLVGGYYRDDCRDLWSSKNGLDWLACETPPWTDVTDFGSAVLTDTILVFGGLARRDSAGNPYIYRFLPAGFVP